MVSKKMTHGYIIILPKQNERDFLKATQRVGQSKKIQTRYSKVKSAATNEQVSPLHFALCNELSVIYFNIKCIMPTNVS